MEFRNKIISILWISETKLFRFCGFPKQNYFDFVDFRIFLNKFFVDFPKNVKTFDIFFDAIRNFTKKSKIVIEIGDFHP